jgi:hypothetical protein
MAYELAQSAGGDRVEKDRNKEYSCQGGCQRVMSHLKTSTHATTDLIQERPDDELRWRAGGTDHMASDAGLADREENNNASTRAIC